MKSKFSIYIPIILSVLLFAAFVPALAAQSPTATTHTVCASGCDYTSIQAAIDAANPGDTLDLISEIYEETITINKSITITGEGPKNTIIQSANAPNIANNRTVTVTSEIDVLIQGLTIRYGKTSGDIPWQEDGYGGGIYNMGNLTISNCTVTSNYAVHGGGIFSSGMLTVTQSTISYNETPHTGGGIYNQDGQALILKSSIHHNDTLYGGGGIQNYLGTFELINSTVSNNSCSDPADGYGGGGITNSTTGESSIIHSTITANDCSRAGGIASSGTAILSIQNSIVANQKNGDDCRSTAIASNGYNIDSDATCGFAESTDMPDTYLELGALGDNGGTTFTHAISTDSPAYNAIPLNHNGCGGQFTEDQRGKQRPMPKGGSCDIGAYEVQSYSIYIPLVAYEYQSEEETLESYVDEQTYSVYIPLITYEYQSKEKTYKDYHESKIAYLSKKGGTQKLYIMNPDGTDQHRLTDSLGWESEASWSPDGKQIVFSNMIGSDQDIFIVDEDGNNFKKITNDPSYASNPTWSPDGKQIAYLTDRHGEKSRLSGILDDEIYVINADGTGDTRVTNDLVQDRLPKWSPTDYIIAAIGNGNLYTIKPDGTEQNWLTNSINVSDFVWAPNGKRIAFVGGDYQIYSIRVNGTNLINLTPNTTGHYNPSWNPQGTKIAYECLSKICVVNADGSETLILTSGLQGNQFSPTWSPDGEIITFVYELPQGGFEFYSMKADGTEITQLTTNAEAQHCYAIWQP